MIEIVWLLLTLVIVACSSFSTVYRRTTTFIHRRPKNSNSDRHVAAMSSSSTEQIQNVVLIGGGHAHVQVIKAYNATSRPANMRVTLVDINPTATYSGMVPGCLAGLYTLDQVLINLTSLADYSGIDFVCGKVVGMSFDETAGQSVFVEETETNGNVINRRQIPFDVVSIDIGSTTRDFTSIPGAKQYTISTRPISDLVRRIEIEDDLIKEKMNRGELSNGLQVFVVGGGAAGIELSLALRARWSDIIVDLTDFSITLIDSNDVLMPSESSACRMALRYIMKKYNIDIKHNMKVDEVTSSHIHVSSNKNTNEREKFPYTHCIWATGAEAHTLALDLHKDCGLDISNRGWIRVNKHLQSTSHPSVFAAGDCCEMVMEKNDKKSPPKAGVYAVRSGPILIENLSRFLGMTSKQMEGGEANHSNNLIVYNPQDDFLKLLMCGDGTALGLRFGIPIYGKWVWRLKDYIDNKFMNLFRVPGEESAGAAMDERHYSLVFCRRIGPESGKREVLLGMKKRGFGIGKWNGYGGKQEMGESMIQCAVRELEEESGIQLSEDLMTPIGYLHFTMRESKKIMHVHVFETHISGDICAVETDEMRPQWYQEDCIPFDEDMWADDPLWFPLFLSGQTFNGKIVFSDDSTIVSHEIAPTDVNDKIDCKIKYDTSQYDREFEVTSERMKAEDGCKLLLRRDDDVDFQTAWSVIREMISDEVYKDDILSKINASPDVWWKELLSTNVFQQEMSVGQMLGGLIFLKTNIRNTLVDFYYQRIGMTSWLEQPNISIMKHGNMIFGFHQITKPDMGHPDLQGMITFVYPSTEQVDEMYHKLLDIADGKPRYNERYKIYQFFAHDPEGRNLEFQAFLHPLLEVSSRPTD